MIRVFNRQLHIHSPSVLLLKRWTSGVGEFQRSSSTKDEELEKFSSFDWWNAEQGEVGSLQHLNPVRCKFISIAAKDWFRTHLSHEASPLRDKTVLDVGCGGGILSESLGRLGGDVLGIDVVESNIQIAKNHLVLDPSLQARVQYQCVSAEALVEEKRKFDLVIASEVIEHVKHPLEFLRTLSMLMKPDGLLCMTTLNRTLRSWTGAIFLAERVFQLLPRRTHEWSDFIAPEELSMAGKQVGLKMEHLVGLELNWLTKKWRLGDDVSVNYAISFSQSRVNVESKTASKGVS